MGLGGRCLHAGTAVGGVLVLGEPLSLWGGADAATGVITDERHPQCGERLGGRVVVMPGSRGSSSSASVLAEMLRAGVGPAALVVLRADPILVIGTMVAEELYGRGIPIVEVAAADLAVLSGWERATITASDGYCDLAEESELEHRFFTEELDEGVRRLLLGEFERRRVGRAQFTFNVVDVLMDFDAQTVTLAGILVSEGEVVLPLAGFRERLVMEVG
ncbi:aconitase X swivel domain-containing protein [Kribbella sp. NPDC058245]|uniref:aconitase X swivel domain-containing protein n=1 Tax=Kribbella sp. NPDC058245 TaxID=3346399 RepID=UPI0036ED48F8